jgi:phage-related protein
MARKVTWVKAALRDFGALPESVQRQMIATLRMAAGGEKAEAAKPLKGLGSGIFEIAFRHRGDAFRAAYAPSPDVAQRIDKAFHDLDEHAGQARRAIPPSPARSKRSTAAHFGSVILHVQRMYSM